MAPSYLYNERGELGANFIRELDANFSREFSSRLGLFKTRMNQLRSKNMSLKVTKKFYVGKASVVNSDWAHTTLAAAINHGRELAETTEEDQIIVQVVRVVRVKKQPIIVEKI